MPVSNSNDSILQQTVDTTVGVGVAGKIKFGGNISFNTKDVSLNKIEFLAKGIDALAPGQEMSSSVTSVRNEGRWFIEEYPPVEITVTWKDAMNGDHNDEFTLDFTQVDLPAWKEE